MWLMQSGAACLQGEGLHKDIDQLVHLQQAVTTKDIRVSFQRSLANVKSMIVTLYTEPFAAPTNNADDNALIASWMKAFQKECNFMYSGRPYILKKTHPGARGALGANGVPAATTGAATQADAIAADNALDSKPTTFQTIWGTKNTRVLKSRMVS